MSLPAEVGGTSGREARGGVAAAASLASVEDTGFLSGSDSVRAAELQAALADRSTRAVLCARGGHGAARLLPLVRSLCKYIAQIHTHIVHAYFTYTR